LGGGEKDAAVVVAIEKYAFLPNVPGADKNAVDWYTYFVKGRLVPAASVRLLVNQEATIEGMKQAAADAAKNVRPGGKVWFVFIGHGAPALDSKGGRLVGYDTQQSAGSLLARSLAQNELSGLLEGRTNKQAVVVVDACYSGRSASGETLVTGAQSVVIVKTINANTVILRAGRSDQIAGPLRGFARPAFSYLLLGALRGWGESDGDADGRVTALEAINYVGTAIKTTVSDREQTPEMSGRGDIVLATKAREQGPPLPDIVSDLLPPPGGAGGAPGGDTPPATAGANGNTAATTLNGCPQSECTATSPLNGVWRCALAGSSQILIDAGRIQIRPRQGMGGTGCLTCSGQFETVSDDGRFSSTNGHFVARLDGASIDWESCASDLASCRASPQRRISGPFACTRASPNTISNQAPAWQPAPPAPSAAFVPVQPAYVVDPGGGWRPPPQANVRMQPPPRVPYPVAGPQYRQVGPAVRVRPGSDVAPTAPPRPAPPPIRPAPRVHPAPAVRPAPAIRPTRPPYARDGQQRL
jgi:hypothetical protein